MNASAPPPNQSKPPELSEQDFAAVAALAHREFGLSLPSSKRQLVQSRLARRLRALNLPSFRDYRSVLEGPMGQPEWPNLLSVLTTNVTKFFREIHHFDVLKDEVMPDLVKRAQNGERVRIWSAGCSSGQEPYSIAMTALLCDPGIARHDFKILATDIDPGIVHKAREGIYRNDELEGVPTSYFRAADVVSARADALIPNGHFSPSQGARDLITFGVVNLIKEWPFSGKFDVIFCRNVAIYFDQPTQNFVWSNFAKLLPEAGRLFIGHSERIRIEDQPTLSPNGITTYCKI